jgi:hypothetical protein
VETSRRFARADRPRGGASIPTVEPTGPETRAGMGVGRGTKQGRNLVIPRTCENLLRNVPGWLIIRSGVSDEMACREQLPAGNDHNRETRPLLESRTSPVGMAWRIAPLPFSRAVSQPPLMQSVSRQTKKPRFWNRAESWSQPEQEDGDTQRGSEVVGGRRARRRCSARCVMRGARSNSACGVAELGADGPARRSGSANSAVRSGPPPIPRRGDHAT